MPWRDNIVLTKPSPQQLQELFTWFDTQAKMLEWGGPDMSFIEQEPDDLDGQSQASKLRTFAAELKLNELASFVLENEHELIGFGQYYSRLEHCHLGRLAINPTYRGQRMIDLLIEFLVTDAIAKLGFKKASLFVLETNTPAIKSYLRCGFEFTAYPEEIGLEGCLYMTKPLK